LNCSKCSKPAVTLIRYSGQHLCNNHFLDFTERRVKKELRRQLNLDGDVTIAVAISGGKDSSVTAYLLSKIFSGRKGVSLEAITVDEGIAGYRPGGIKAARDLCECLGIPHQTTSYKELLGWTMDRVVKTDPRTIPCSYCGVFRRYSLNRKARELKADYLATGLNLDDTSQSVLMNVARGDMGRLARLGPHDREQEDMIPRLQPLRLVPEKESHLYAVLRQIKFHDAICPYSDRAVRGLFRDALNRLEEGMPGTRHSILSSFDQMRPWLDRQFSCSKAGKCNRCGEPTMNPVCKACELIEKLQGLST